MLAAVAAGTSPIIPELPIIRADGAGEQRATFFELFFDLVYVFAVTQLSHHLLAEITWAGAAETAFMLVALYWAWNYTTWMTNWFDPDTVPVRLVLVFVMLASLLMAVAIPQGFGEYALLFACAYSGNDGRLLPVIEEPHSSRSLKADAVLGLAQDGRVQARKARGSAGVLGRHLDRRVQPAKRLHIPGRGRAIRGGDHQRRRPIAGLAASPEWAFARQRATGRSTPSPLPPRPSGPSEARLHAVAPGRPRRATMTSPSEILT